ncbi:transcriptional corepressor [Moniliophthora roreri MCA 2997]|uniref:Transcriptional corepressor n=1 Tax=Moniliophthora roreri (strain MCA 2997) TaxID=1381753 RepID=V2XG35_MONRO|nr:transcriptional corepressor [Moniliophthora roreri MCA 2997]
MSLRHIPRSSDRDIRMHDPPPPPPPPPSAVVHPHIPHPPHPNGASSAPPPPPPPPPPTLSNGTNHLVSPTAVTTSVPNGPSTSMIQKLNTANEQTWLLIGRVAEQMGDLEHALSAYENALRHNPMSLSGLTQVAGIARIKENYPKAIEFFQRVLSLQEENGEVWSALGHCYLMQDDLQKAYSAYQQALYLLPNPREDPKLWYGIGILYDRYGSLDHAEEAFSSVLRMDKDLDFDKANEILFRLGIIYKQQGKYEDSLVCFDRILRNPPSPLAHADIWFQIGHVYEQQKDHVRAKDAYERVVADNPGHAKVLQQLGWLYHQDGSSFQNQDLAIQYLTKSLEADSSDAQSWYLLGRAYMAGQKYNKAYEAYQQAVYRDGRNPTFWCSIGVLYFQINQFRDALDAYSRAIRINPYISEVWFDLGSLYESCNNQISDAIDAYARASELDPGNHVISSRLQLLKQAQATGGQLPAAPGPQDVHPTAYASAVVPPPGLSGPPLLLQPPNQRTSSFRADSRGPTSEISLPPPSTGQSSSATRSPPGPFRGGPPPPVIIDENRHHPPHTPLAPMDVDRPLPSRGGHTRDYSQDRSQPPPSSLLLHHPPSDDREPPSRPQHDSYFTRGHGRPGSRSVSPTGPPQSAIPRGRSPPPPFQTSSRMAGPGQPMIARSPRQYQASASASHPEDGPWRPSVNDHRDSRDWDRERRRDYPTSGPGGAFYPPRERSPPRHSPVEPSPRSGHRIWESVVSKPSHHSRAPSPPPPPPELPRGRFDPRSDARVEREYDRLGLDREMRDVRDIRDRDYPPSHPDAVRRDSGGPSARVISSGPPPPPPFTRNSESPHPEGGKSRRRNGNGNGAPKEPSGPSTANTPTNVPGSKSKRSSRRSGKEERGFNKSGSPSAASTSSHSANGHTPRPPSRIVDEDYDEGVADTLMSLASAGGASRDRDVVMGSPHDSVSGRPHPPSHRDSVSSTRSFTMASASPHSLKRALSPDREDDKRPSAKRRLSMSTPTPPGSGGNDRSSNGRRTPIPGTSTRPSPIPFRQQPSSAGPNSRSPEASPVSGGGNGLGGVLPPHPRPVGLSSSSREREGIALPPIATLSPTSTAPSPQEVDRDEERESKRLPVESSPKSRAGGNERATPSPKNSRDRASGSPNAEKKTD